MALPFSSRHSFGWLDLSLVPPPLHANLASREIVMSKTIILLEFAVSSLALNRHASACLVLASIFHPKEWLKVYRGWMQSTDLFLTTILSSVPVLSISLSKSDLHLACESSSSTCGNFTSYRCKKKSCPASISSLQKARTCDHGRSGILHV